MKLAGILLSMIIITACSTAYDLKHSKPRFQYTTERSASEVMECISKKWEKHMSPVKVEKLFNGWMIENYDVFPSSMKVLVTIETIESHVDVKYFQNTKVFKLHRAVEDVESCR